MRKPDGKMSPVSFSLAVHGVAFSLSARWSQRGGNKMNGIEPQDLHVAAFPNFSTAK